MYERFNGTYVSIYELNVGLVFGVFVSSRFYSFIGININISYN